MKESKPKCEFKQRQVKICDLIPASPEIPIPSAEDENNKTASNEEQR